MQSDSNSQFYEDPNDAPIGESLFSVSGWLAALAAMACIGMVQVIDVADHRAEWKQSADLKQEQEAAERSERRALAAQALCTSDHGPQALAVWISDTTIECVSPRGRRLSRAEVQ